MTEPHAKIIADSISPDGVRLTSTQVTGHRFMLPEFNTHRRFSRNSASSRAIPLVKQLDRVTDDPAYPLVFPAEQKGMQGGEPLDEVALGQAHDVWGWASRQASMAAEELGSIGVHKSVANRLLEPFMWHTIVVTSTAWENFFEQRCSPLAQPEIRAMAEAMRDAMAASTPEPLKEGEWHLPYFSDEDYDLLSEREDVQFEDAAKVSAARCARVSYLTQDGKRDIQADLDLYERLTTAQPAHWSPLEHVATPWPENRQEGSLWWYTDENGRDEASHRVPTDHLPRVGNLLGWRSLRTTVEAERGAVTWL